MLQQRPAGRGNLDKLVYTFYGPHWLCSNSFWIPISKEPLLDLWCHLRNESCLVVFQGGTFSSQNRNSSSIAAMTISLTFCFMTVKLSAMRGKDMHRKTVIELNCRANVKINVLLWDFEFKLREACWLKECARLRLMMDGLAKFGNKPRDGKGTETENQTVFIWNLKRPRTALWPHAWATASCRRRYRNWVTNSLYKSLAFLPLHLREIHYFLDLPELKYEDLDARQEQSRLVNL